MNGIMGYAQLLRAIGQALETLNIQSFEIEPLGGNFFIRGNVLSTSSAELLDGNKKLTYDELRRAIWGKLPDANGGNVEDTDATSLTVHSPVELLYGVKDVERLEEEGRSKRVNPQGTANPSSLSQVLRCIGAYLNQKRARLLKLSREAETVAVEYETSLGTTIKEIFSLSDLYDLWVRMYLQRAERTSP